METVLGLLFTIPEALLLPWLGWFAPHLAPTAIGLIGSFFGALFYLARGARKRRLHPRQELVSQVHVWWRDGAAEREFDGASCRDFSAGGMALELPEPIRVDTLVALHVPSLNFRGFGSVRHCTPIESGYLVGIRFSRLTRALAGLTSGNSGTGERRQGFRGKI